MTPSPDPSADYNIAANPIAAAAIAPTPISAFIVGAPPVLIAVLVVVVCTLTVVLGIVSVLVETSFGSAIEVVATTTCVVVGMVLVSSICL